MEPVDVGAALLGEPVLAACGEMRLVGLIVDEAHQPVRGGGDEVLGIHRRQRLPSTWIASPILACLPVYFFLKCQTV